MNELRIRGHARVHRLNIPSNISQLTNDDDRNPWRLTFSSFICGEVRRALPCVLGERGWGGVGRVNFAHFSFASCREGWWVDRPFLTRQLAQIKSSLHMRGLATAWKHISVKWFQCRIFQLVRIFCEISFFEDEKWI